MTRTNSSDYGTQLSDVITTPTYVELELENPTGSNYLFYGVARATFSDLSSNCRDESWVLQADGDSYCQGANRGNSGITVPARRVVGMFIEPGSKISFFEDGAMVMQFSHTYTHTHTYTHLPTLCAHTLTMLLSKHRK